MSHNENKYYGYISAGRRLGLFPSKMAITPLLPQFRFPQLLRGLVVTARVSNLPQDSPEVFVNHDFIPVPVLGDWLLLHTSTRVMSQYWIQPTSLQEIPKTSTDSPTSRLPVQLCTYQAIPWKAWTTWRSRTVPESGATRVSCRQPPPSRNEISCSVAECWREYHHAHSRLTTSN
jgi:hypothetical protein